MEDRDLEAKKAFDAEFAAIQMEYGIDLPPDRLNTFEQPDTAPDILMATARRHVHDARRMLEVHKQSLVAAQSARTSMTKSLIAAKSFLDAASKLGEG